MIDEFQTHVTASDVAKTSAQDKVISQVLEAFNEGDGVFVRNYGGSPLWTPGKLLGATGPHSYKVLLDDGRLCHKHIDQLRSHPAHPSNTQESEVATTPKPKALNPSHAETMQDLPVQSVLGLPDQFDSNTPSSAIACAPN
ncbi:hypothetical protein E2320_002073, partial [Naja naja]